MNWDFLIMLLCLFFSMYVANKMGKEELNIWIDSTETHTLYTYEYVVCKVNSWPHPFFYVYSTSKERRRAVCRVRLGKRMRRNKEI